jgi:hypothetical protein
MAAPAAPLIVQFNRTRIAGGWHLEASELLELAAKLPTGHGHQRLPHCGRRWPAEAALEGLAR